MKVRVWLVLAGFVCLQTACAKAKGFRREEMVSEMAVTIPEFNEQDIKDAYLKKPNLPKNARVGVYFKNPKQEYYYSEKRWRWTEEDRKLIEKVAEELKNQGITAEVFPILSPVVQGEDLRSLRLAAAKHRADALMIISGAGEIDRYTNNWAWTYALIAPAFFIPGTQADTLFITSASLWDVKNEFLYLTAESEGLSKDTHAAFLGKKDRDLLEEAKIDSLSGLSQEIVKLVKSTAL